MLAGSSYGHTHVNQQMQLTYINCEKSYLESHRDSKQEEDRKQKVNLKPFFIWYFLYQKVK